MVRSVRGYLVVPLKPSWEKGTQLGVHCGDGAVAGVATGVGAGAREFCMIETLPLLAVLGQGGESRLRPVLVGFIIRPLVKVGTSRGVCGVEEKFLSAR